MRHLSLLFLLLMSGIVSPARAQTSFYAASVDSGDEIVLNDGRILHLHGIAGPFAQNGEWPDKARKFLAELTENRALEIENETTDRYGRICAQVYALDTNGNKIWLQGEMLRQGLAFVYPPTGDEARLDEMLAAEEAARRGEIAMWNDAAYADTPADRAWPKKGHFAFIRGKVVDAARVKNMVYLNFGSNWRTDFTIAIAAHDLLEFRKAGFEPLDLKGATIRTRGWVKRDFGPMIVVTDPKQIEILRVPDKQVTAGESEIAARR